MLWNLTGGKVHACDMTNASRTQLFNLHTLSWDAELLALFGIPAAALPTVMASSTVFGETAPLGSLPGGIPIAALIGDSHAALFGHAGFQRGAIKATYGTGSSLMTPIEQPILSERGLSTTVAWAVDKTTYALEGNISVTGAAVEWLGQLLGLERPAEEVAKLAEQVADSDGVYLVPAFVGLGAPHWRPEARGLLTGLTRGSGPAQARHAGVHCLPGARCLCRHAGRRHIELEFSPATAAQAAQLTDAVPGGHRATVLRSTSTDASALGAVYLACLSGGCMAFTGRTPRCCRRTPF